MTAPTDSDHPEREYRISVLATWKAIAWLSVPVVFGLMAWLRVGDQFVGWAQRGFLKKDPWGFDLSPFMWAAIAAVVATAVYSSFIKWAWDTWDRREKYAEGPSEPHKPTGSDGGKPDRGPGVPATFDAPATPAPATEGPKPEVIPT